MASFEWMLRLKRLGELRDKGLITDEEFEAFRIKIVPSPDEMLLPRPSTPDPNLKRINRNRFRSGGPPPSGRV